MLQKQVFFIVHLKYLLEIYLSADFPEDVIEKAFPF